MTRETMTIHKALSELKVLDARIETAINTPVYCCAKKHSTDKVAGTDVTQIEKNIRSYYDKAVDLINRRKAIKRAVVLSNAVTKVSVCGVEYTVAEAIEMKNHGIEFEQRLSSAMKRDYTKAQATISKENGNGLEERADQYVTDIYGQKDSKTNAADIEKVRNDFITSNQFELVDPIGVLEKIDDIDKITSGFLTEVDSQLSVSNALTEITIEY